jgi:transposase
MDYIEGANRAQRILLPESLDEYISDESPVRVIDAFVDSLDLKQMQFKHATLNETGRPPYHPSVLLKLYVYGYLHRIRSSRMLEKETHRNVEVLWLLGKLQPDFKTIANFRRDNGPAIREVCRSFTAFCRDMELFGGELVAIDGSKFKAVNSPSRNYTAKSISRSMKRIDSKIDEYLEELDRNDELEPDDPKLTKEELEDKIRILKEMMKKNQGLREQLEESNESQISLTDPDSRSMAVGGKRRTSVGYNVQVAVDEKNKMIVDHEVTNSVNDHGLLSEMAIRAKMALGVEKLEVLADLGYRDGAEVKRCVDSGITPFIPKVNVSANSKLGLYGKQDFKYLPEDDEYLCPAGERLTNTGKRYENRRLRKFYSTRACRDCGQKPLCTRSRQSRRISRWEFEDVLEEMDQRVQVQPEKIKLRKALAEHPFGTIKYHWHHGNFLMKRLPNVRTEMSLSILAYNMKRAISVMGVKTLLEALA